MLRAHDLAVSYDGVTAVSGLHLEVQTGQTLVLLGRSGSGKTTVLRAIAGLVTPDAGTIEFAGDVLDGVPAHRRRFGLVFQDFALFPHLDVGDNVAYGLRMLGVDNVAERVADALDMVGLRGMERRRIDQLSGGQAQRVALARTLAPEPRLLLLDEPLGSLDPDLRTELASELKDLLATTGVPTIVVTHDTAEALALGDRIAIIVDGRIACEGTPEQVWSEPGSVDAARLLGHRGIVPADVAGGVAAAGSARIPVDAADGPTTLLIRSGGVTTPGPTPGIVVDSRYRGPEWLVTVAIGRGTVEVLTTIRPEVGASIGLTIDPTSVTSLT